jgi:hypothetical protein
MLAVGRNSADITAIFQRPVLQETLRARASLQMGDHHLRRLAFFGD